jgi:hypothetical protein
MPPVIRSMVATRTERGGRLGGPWPDRTGAQEKEKEKEENP